MKTILVPLSGAPQQIVTTSTNNGFWCLTAFGFSGFSGSAPLSNAATAYIGYETGRMPFEVGVGSYATIETPSPIRSPDNLANLWVRGTSGDGLYFVVY